jgi:hypothetical protein
MKYMIMMFGDQESMMSMRDMKWVKEMVQFMTDLNTELVNNGEFVVAEGLADAPQAKLVSYRDNEVVVTDGPFAESKESLAGFWIVNVASEERALEITRKIVAFTHGDTEVRFVPDGPPPEFLD